MSREIIIGIDAGTSVIKSVAFDLSGRQLDVASRPNSYDTGPGGAVTQPLARTWSDCAATLRALADKMPDLPSRVAAIAVTGQGDGTWLVGADNTPVGDGWLWLDARAGDLAEEMRRRDGDTARYMATGTGLNACQQGAQLAYMQTHMPEALAQAECALHCKDWLYLKLTGERVTDPSEGSFTFGDFRTRTYDDGVLEFLGLTAQRHLLPPMCDGTATQHALTPEAAEATGLRAGTPVALGHVDVTCTTLGGGGYLPGQDTGCTIVGTTGVHIGCKQDTDVQLNPAERTGYVMTMPVPGVVAHLQTNMAGTMNIDWVLGLARDVCTALGVEVTQERLLEHVERWMADSPPGHLIYHPHISEAGERGPFIDQTARSSFIGLSTAHGFADLVRGAVEGLAMASRDCYSAMGPIPASVTLTGGAARSDALRATLAATLGASVRRSSREEAGAAGAAMIAAVGTGVYADMTACIQDWVVPTLTDPEAPDPSLSAIYDRVYPQYVASRAAVRPIWHAMAQHRSTLV
ncbi:FGGY-family carbohydrate kinase [uncultured Roseobacter sp.]|uniref:FGGY-family carbohydrate kinase n=1 Tax=uncultured Roseobacter sp. TaxID=114847 RepID=UPI0026064F71|nr:FGGY-family carbohydrate kinase [uncultured Roseobacter sp.]